MSTNNKYIELELARTIDTLQTHSYILKTQIDEAHTFQQKMALLRGAILDSTLGFPAFATALNMPYFLYPVVDQFFSKVFETRYNLGMWPRSCLKTTMACAYAGWFYVYHSLVTKIQPRTLILHSDESKAKEDLDLVKEYLDNPLIVALFEDLLVTDISSRGELNFDYSIEGAIPRKESHFVARSMYASTGGQHFSFYLLDDMCVKENTSTVEKNNQVWDVYKKLPWLDDKSGLYKVLEVGTAYTDDCHHAYICGLAENNTPNYNVVRVPAVTYTPDGEAIYNFPDRWGADELAQALLDVKGDMAEFQAHMNQIFYRRGDTSINLCFDKSMVYTAFPPSNNNYVVVTAADPATSKNNKKLGDAKSRATLLTARVYDDDMMYVCGCWQSMGEELEKWIEYCVDQINLHKTNLFIQDAQGTQEHHFSFQMKQINDAVKRRLTALPHKKTPLTGTYSKMEVAAAMLAQRFLAGKILIHESLALVVNQLLRLDAGFDIIDCLVYIVVHTKPYHITMAMSQRDREEGEKRGRQKKKVPLMAGDGFKLR